MGKIYQIIGSAIISCTCLNIGVGFTWPAFTILLFASEHTPLHRPMTETELSLLGSLSSIGAVLSTMAAGFLLDRLGRKKCCIISALCLVMFWGILFTSKRVEAVLAAVFMSGLANSGILIASVYISEICQESIRGWMSAGILTFNGMGFVVSYLLGGYLEYTVTLYIGLSMTVSAVAFLFFLKETPTHLMRCGKEQESVQALAFYRHLKSDDAQIIEEINILKRILNTTQDSELSTDLTSEIQKLNPEVKPVEKLSFWQIVKKSESTRRALFVTIVMFTAGIYQGQVIVLMYAEPLFSVAIPSMAPALSSVIMAVIVVIASSIAGYLSDIAGRRPLMICGSFGAAISCVVLGTQMHLNWGPIWLTAIFMYVFPVMFTIGAGTIPMVLVSEVFLPEVKSILSMVALEWIWTCNFTLLFVFNPVLKAIGWGPVFYIFGIICLSTAIFSVFCLPETKGLTVEEIQPLFMKKKNRNYC